MVSRWKGSVHIVSPTEESEMLCCFLLVKADRVLDYCKKGPAEAVVCGIKNENWSFWREKNIYAHTQTKIVYCSQVSLHFQPCKTKQSFFTRTLEYNAWLWQYYIKCCPCCPIYVSLCDKLGEENYVRKFSVTLCGVYFVSSNVMA